MGRHNQQIQQQEQYLQQHQPYQQQPYQQQPYQQQPYQQQPYQQQPQAQSYVVAVPPDPAHNQDMVLVREEQESRGSKLKGFFKRSNKKKITLSSRDAQILAQVKTRAKVLDTGLNLGFAKIGIDPIIGLVPVAGDAITMMLALRLIHTAQKADIPKSLTQRMLFNVALDFGIGLVPVIGDFGDFLFKANDKNAKLFEAYLYERAAAQAAEVEAAAASRARLATPPTAAAPVAPNYNTNKSSQGFSFFGRGHHQDRHQPQHTAVEMGSVAV
ncbi:hypothetical protein EDD11_000840 [Mortierella claussenii]|nr:hypothetical protein EDD11_000840 [Mortierella claussenii]